ncbi:acid-soluble spore protein N, partial [Bacillus atrophaeus]|nr:acid-soluble spore protein N [Bacillus atrophaeus]
QYAPSHLVTKPVKYKRTKGEKLHDTSNEQPIIMQTKGE